MGPHGFVDLWIGVGYMRSLLGNAVLLLTVAVILWLLRPICMIAAVVWIGFGDWRAVAFCLAAGWAADHAYFRLLEI